MRLVDNATLIDDLLADDTVIDNQSAASTEIQFVMKKYLLENILDKAAMVVSSRNDVMPVLRCFQFDVRPDKLRVSASDMEQSVIATTELVTVTKPGLAVFPVKKLLDIMHEASGDEVSIRVRNTHATVTIGRAFWNLSLRAGDDFPNLRVASDGSFATIGRVDFLAALNHVRYAASKDTSRSPLMVISTAGGKLTACDGARFQQVALPDLPLALQIPIGAVDTLIKLLKRTALDEITLGEVGNTLVFRFGSDVLLVNKLIAQFPDSEGEFLRPAMENKHSLIVDREELIAAVRRVRINADHNTAAIGLELTTGQLTVVGRDGYHNDATETIPAEWTGSDRTLVVNHAYLTDLVSRYDGKSCHFKLGNDTKTRRSSILLRDETTAGVVQQMNMDW